MLDRSHPVLQHRREGQSHHAYSFLQCESDTHSIVQASDSGAAAILGLLGIVIQGVDVLVGLDCSPITVIGVGTGNSCSANAVCCQNNNVVSTLQRLVGRS